MMRLLLAGFASIALVAIDAAANEELDAAFAKSSIVIEAGTDACYRFDAYLAGQSAEWRRGLMHVRQLDAFTGMLFLYPDAAMRSMWMKNTYIPLDILFIRSDGVIDSIAADTEPLSLNSIRSGESVQFVLELNAGTTAGLNIGPGDKLLWAGDPVGMPSEH